MRPPQDYRCVTCRRFFRTRHEPKGCPTCKSGNIRVVPAQKKTA
jgi:Zn finger protein HypA/HybF involved in hydrogenase expression